MVGHGCSSTTPKPINFSLWLMSGLRASGDKIRGYPGRSKMRGLGEQVMGYAKASSKEAIPELHHLYKNHGAAHQHQAQRQLFPNQHFEKVGASETQLPNQNNDT